MHQRESIFVIFIKNGIPIFFTKILLMYQQPRQIMKVHVVKSADSDTGVLFIAAVRKACRSVKIVPERVAFDCEGCQLSRLGSVEVVSICFSSMQTFLVDLGGEPNPQVVQAVKALLEDAKVIKIIHDCRMDSDALFHLHGIKLNNVHDTSCFHNEITGEYLKSLNYVLSRNGVRFNIVRANNVYKIDPDFWKTRPLTKMMIDWASSDVAKLFDVAWRQVDGQLNDAGISRALAASAGFTSSVRGMDVVEVSGFALRP
jgi:exonuclease 3'-5' domain-containing protein 1